jgi:hypothetical protein
MDNRKSSPLKGQSHEKVGELMIWGVKLSPNQEQLLVLKFFWSAL